MTKIIARLFAGAANVTNGTLADVLRNLCQREAKVLAGAVAGLTDNSGGAAADGTIGAIPLLPTTPAAGATCPTKAEVETAAGTIVDAITELAAKVVAINAVVPALNAPANNVGGAAADGTIAAITTSFTGATAARVSATGFAAFVAEAEDRLMEIAGDVNKLAVATADSAMDLSALARRSDFSGDYAAISTDTGTAAADGTESVDDAEAEAVFAALADAVAEIAAKLNEIVDGADVPLASVAA